MNRATTPARKIRALGAPGSRCSTSTSWSPSSIPITSHHEPAHDWFADHRAAGWATCAMTENGFIRVLAYPAYGAALKRPLELVTRLRQFCSSGDHVFWTSSVSIRDAGVFNPAFIGGHRQLTDVYLLGLAVRMGGCLATFDRAIPLAAVVGATRESIAVVSAAALEE